MLSGDHGIEYSGIKDKDKYVYEVFSAMVFNLSPICQCYVNHTILFRSYLCLNKGGHAPRKDTYSL